MPMPNDPNDLSEITGDVPLIPHQGPAPDLMASAPYTLPESVWANHRTVVVDTTWALEPHSIPPGVVRRVTDRLATTDPATGHAHASPTDTAAYLRREARDLRQAASKRHSAVGADPDYWHDVAMAESLDSLAEQLDPQHCPPTPAEIAEHMAEWAKTPTSFEMAERERSEGGDDA